MRDKNEKRLRSFGVKNTVTHYMPEWLLLTYHWLLAVIALAAYRHPSRHLVVIGITGTKGKTTTALFMHAVLSAAGEKVGLLSTVSVKIGDETRANVTHMTMPGRGFVQKQLRRMVDAGCTYAVVEAPSEGILQFRDLGVRYDSVVMTNLATEHLITHRTFERYRDTKCRLFRRHARGSPKKIDGEEVRRFVLLNADDAHMEYFLRRSVSPVSEQILFGLGSGATERAFIENGVKMNSFFLKNERYVVQFPGSMTVRNVLPAILLAKRYCNASAQTINGAFSSIILPGRMESIEEGQPFRVFCDYAHEPLSIASVYDALKDYAGPGGKVIMVVGAVGGGRWKYNARQIGETATAYAQVTVITDVDPFFDDPRTIINAVAEGAGKNKKAKWYVEPDRRDAIYRAVSLARGGDVVIITGKGAEMTMEVRGESLPWDERGIIRETIRTVIRERAEKHH